MAYVSLPMQRGGRGVRTFAGNSSMLFVGCFLRVQRRFFRSLFLGRYSFVFCVECEGGRFDTPEGATKDV